MTVGTLYQVDLLYEIPGKQGAMTFHFVQLGSSPSAAALDSEFCFDSVVDPLATELATLMPSQLSFLGGYCREATLGTPTVYPFLGLLLAPVVGATTSEILPEGTGPLILIGPSLISSSPRREVNRKYFPVMAEVDQADGAVSSSYVADIENVFDTLFDPTTYSSDFQMMTYSRKAESEASTFAWEAETIRVSDQIARLVRRRPRYQGRS